MLCSSHLKAKICSFVSFELGRGLLYELLSCRFSIVGLFLGNCDQVYVNSVVHKLDYDVGIMEWFAVIHEEAQ